MKFQDIPQFPQAYWSTHVAWVDLRHTLDRWDNRGTGECPQRVILDPDFQRGQVWTKKQKIAYVEYILKGGTTGKEVYFNCSSWGGDYNTNIYCVDGLQRMSAVLDFIDDKLPIFGQHKYSDFEGTLRGTHHRFVFNMLCIKRKKELLKVYYDFNSGGTPHKPSEIARIAKMIEETPDTEKL